MHQLSQSVLAYIGRHDLIRAGHKVGVAVSGGADSTALLRILLELAPELGIVLEVVHLNHRLRGDASVEDQHFVRDLAAAHHLPFHCETKDAAEFARQKHVGLEAAGRQLRYDFFRSLLEPGRLDRIATAHTLNDQAETVLLKLSRGAGTRGVAGIFPEVTVPARLNAMSVTSEERSHAGAIVRPLLGTTRGEIEAFLHDIGQSWREDSTNRELQHTRNRIRHSVIPMLVRDVNPNILITLAESAEIARAEEIYWAQLTAQQLASCFEPNRSGGTLNCEVVRKLPLALRRRVVRAAGEAIGLRLGFHQVEQVLDLFGETGRATLSEGWTVHSRNQNVWFEKEGCEEVYSLPLQVPGEVTVGDNAISASLVSASTCESEPLLDGTVAEGGLEVRNWRDGERFWPVHRKRPHKIKELLQDRHVSGSEKKGWPVIAAGEQVVWLSGYGVGREFISKGSTGVLIREMSPKKECS